MLCICNYQQFKWIDVCIFFLLKFRAIFSLFYLIYLLNQILKTNLSRKNIKLILTTISNSEDSGEEYSKLMKTIKIEPSVKALRFVLNLHVNCTNRQNRELNSYIIYMIFKYMASRKHFTRIMYSDQTLSKTICLKDFASVLEKLIIVSWICFAKSNHLNFSF